MKPEAEQTAQSNVFSEPRLGPDFAARVIRQARVERKRRLHRRVALGAGLSLALVVGAIPLMRGGKPVREEVASSTTQVEVAQEDIAQEDAATNQTELAEADTTALTDSSETEQTDASGYLFPEAQSLADFAENYRSDSIDYSNTEGFDTVASNF